MTKHKNKFLQFTLISLMIHLAALSRLLSYTPCFARKVLKVSNGLMMIFRGGLIHIGVLSGVFAST